MSSPTQEPTLSHDDMERSRALLRKFIANPKFQSELFTSIYSTTMQDVDDMERLIPRLPSPSLQRHVQQVTLSISYNTWTVMQILEALAENLSQTRKEFGDALEALSSKTMTKEEAARALAKVKGSLLVKVPDQEDMTNIKWVRNFLRKSATTGGSGS